MFVPLFKLPTFLLPIHVMLLELIIDPTSSIVFQRIKPSKDIMKENPRNINESILNLKSVITSVLQGLLIFLVVFITYFVLVRGNAGSNLSVTIAYATLVLSIMLITYQLRGHEWTLKAFVRSFKDRVSLLVNLGVMIGLIVLIYIPFLNSLANTTPLGLKWWFVIICLVLLSVVPFDILKFKRKK